MQIAYIPFGVTRPLRLCPGVLAYPFAKARLREGIYYRPTGRAYIEKRHAVGPDACMFYSVNR